MKNRPSIAFIFGVSICLIACGRSGGTGNVDSDKQALLTAATDYANVGMRAFRLHEPITIAGLTLEPGERPGQTMRPRIDQLKEMGFVNKNYDAGGEVSMSFGNCNPSAPGASCVLAVNVVVSGSKVETHLRKVQ